MELEWTEKVRKLILHVQSVPLSLKDSIDIIHKQRITYRTL